MNSDVSFVAVGRSRYALAALWVVGVLVSAACGTRAESPVEPSTRTRQVVVAVDFSGSRSDTELEHSKNMIRGLVGRLKVGDQMTVIPVTGRDSTRRPSRLHTVPPSTGSRSRDERRILAVRSDIENDVTTLFEERHTMGLSSTDILTTLFQVRDYVLEADGRHVDLVILSDMIHDAGGIDFSHAKDVPPDAWITARRAKDLVPRLERVCVTVVGADSSTAAGIARRDFWQTYFAAAGAELAEDRYRRTLTQFDGALCTT